MIAASIFGAYYYLGTLPKKVTSYQNIKLGDTKESVELALGVPSNVSLPPEKKKFILENETIPLVFEVTKMATRKEIESNPRNEKGYDDWEFRRPGFSVFVKFDQTTEKLKLISCYIFDFSKIDHEACSVNKIHAADSEEKIIGALGKPDSIERAGPTKILNYPALNMLILVDKEGIFNIQIKDARFTAR
ncbi:hypothetical protein G6655_05825 [Polynucleobacter paneuropaeus]|nr:hypothetical protein [Polynucleobacter paneuropaeus]